MELHMLMAACSGSVEECGAYYGHHVNPRLSGQLEELAGISDTCCSPLIYSMQTRTLSMYGY